MFRLICAYSAFRCLHRFRKLHMCNPSSTRISTPVRRAMQCSRERPVKLARCCAQRRLHRASECRKYVFQLNDSGHRVRARVGNLRGSKVFVHCPVLCATASPAQCCSRASEALAASNLGSYLRDQFLCRAIVQPTHIGEKSRLHSKSLAGGATHRAGRSTAP